MEQDSFVSGSKIESDTDLIEATLKSEKAPENIYYICYTIKNTMTRECDKIYVYTPEFYIGKGFENESSRSGIIDGCKFVEGDCDELVKIGIEDDYMMLTNFSDRFNKKKIKEGVDVEIGRTKKLMFYVFTANYYNNGIEFNKMFVPIKEIGFGSFSHTYHARNKINGTECAIKTIKECYLKVAKHKKKVLNEIDILKKIEHPFIIGYIGDYFFVDTFYLLLEYAPLTLHDYINKNKEANGLVKLGVCESLFKQLCCAVYYLHHTCKIIHRDIKCENILIDKHDNCKLIDFGLSIKESEASDSCNTIGGVGTPDYMAPETKNNPAIYSFSSDCWSVGCVLYYMITGNFETANINKDSFNLIRDSKYANLIGYGKDFLKENPRDRPSMLKVMEMSFFDSSLRRCLNATFRNTQEIPNGNNLIEKPDIISKKPFNDIKKSLTTKLKHQQLEEKKKSETKPKKATNRTKSMKLEKRKSKQEIKMTDLFGASKIQKK